MWAGRHSTYTSKVKTICSSADFATWKVFWNPRARKTSATAPGKSYLRIIGFSLPMFEHAQEYRRVNRALLGSDAEAVVRRRIHSVLAGIVSRELGLELRQRKIGNGPVSPELLAHFLVSTYISVLTWWLNSRSPVPPKEIDVAYRHLVLPCLTSLFG
jgi:hypothetical protein